MAWQGFLLAFMAAVSHSCIDSLRKIASRRFDTTQCVCLVALLEGSLSFAFVAGQVLPITTFVHEDDVSNWQLQEHIFMQGTFYQQDDDSSLWTNRPFLFCAFMSAALRLLSLLLYQTAIQLAPLSVTIPYLSFTPAMLLCTAYLMIGEQPSWSGLLGVMIVTLGGYLLAFSSSGPTSKKEYNLTDGGKSSIAAGPSDENLTHLEMGSKLLLMDDGVRKGLGGVVVSPELMYSLLFQWCIVSSFCAYGHASMQG
jgi:uncharacterized membrane protein